MVEMSRIRKVFHANGFFLYPLKASENLLFSDVLGDIKRDYGHEMGKIIRLRNAQGRLSFTEAFMFKDKLIIIVEIVILGNDIGKVID